MVPSGFAYEAREEYNPRAKRGFDVKQMVRPWAGWCHCAP